MADAEWKLTIDGFEIDMATYDHDGWHIELHSISCQAACPSCGQPSRHVHSYYRPLSTTIDHYRPLSTTIDHYRRRLRDLPVEAQGVELLIRVRRFECPNDDCTRKVFCERLNDFAKAYSRRSERLTAMIRAIGFALNAERPRRGVKAVRDWHTSSASMSAVTRSSAG